MKIAGLDIGTTGCKCTVFDEQGVFLGKSYQDYKVVRNASAHEINGEALLQSCLSVIKNMAEQYPDIGGIGVTSFGEGFVLAEEDGTPLSPIVLATDPKGEEECQELIDTFGEKEIMERVGVRPHATLSLCKLKWFSKHQPELLEKAAHIFMVEDFIVFHLTGNPQLERSLAVRSMALNVQTLDWDEELLGAAGVKKAQMSKLVPSGTSAGCVSSKTVELTGLNKDTVIVDVAHDQIAATVGAGVFAPGILVDGAGTVQCLNAICNQTPELSTMFDASLPIVPFLDTEEYLTFAYSFTGGALLQWCVETVAKAETIVAKEQGLSVNEYLETEYIKNRGDKPGDLLVLPHFAGAANPYMDAGSKGAVLGMTMDTTVADLYRGCMEGVVLEMYLNYKTLLEAGLSFDKVHATGGPSKSAVLMQMKADILNIPITTLKTIDAGTVGCAMMTGVAIGVFENLQDATEHMVKEDKTYYPRKEMHELYEKKFETYEKVYGAVRPLV